MQSIFERFFCLGLKIIFLSRKIEIFHVHFGVHSLIFTFLLCEVFWNDFSDLKLAIIFFSFPIEGIFQRQLSGKRFALVARKSFLFETFSCLSNPVSLAWWKSTNNNVQIFFSQKLHGHITHLAKVPSSASFIFLYARWTRMRLVESSKNCVVKFHKLFYCIA